MRRLDPRLAWDERAYLLALVADNLAFLRYELAGGKGRKPKPVKRPQAARPRKQERTVHGMSAAEVGAVLFAPRS